MTQPRNPPRRRPAHPSSPSTSTHSSVLGEDPSRKGTSVTFVNPQEARLPPIVYTFDSDDPFNNTIRGADRTARYIISTPKRGGITTILGRRKETPQSEIVDRTVAHIVRSRWKSDRVAFGNAPPTEISKLFEKPRHLDSLSEVDRHTFNDENDRRYEWRGAHIYRALQLWTVDQPQLLVAQFRYPDGGKPQLVLESPNEGFANLDMIIVTFLLLDKDRKRGTNGLE